jgi:hypothetical protein
MPRKTTSAAKPAPVSDSPSLTSLSKVELIALGQAGGQSAVDAGLEMLRRATNRQNRKQA